MPHIVVGTKTENHCLVVHRSRVLCIIICAARGPMDSSIPHFPSNANPYPLPITLRQPKRNQTRQFRHELLTIQAYRCSLSFHSREDRRRYIRNIMDTHRRHDCRYLHKTAPISSILQTSISPWYCSTPLITIFFFFLSYLHFFFFLFFTLPLSGQDGGVLDLSCPDSSHVRSFPSHVVVRPFIYCRLHFLPSLSCHLFPRH